MMDEERSAERVHHYDVVSVSDTHNTEAEDSLRNWLATGLHAAFFVALFLVVLQSPLKIFFGKYGRRHRLAGLVHLCMLAFGMAAVLQLFLPPFEQRHWVCYHFLLGVTGITATFTAAFDFKDHHKKKRNVASGSLEADAT